MGTTQSSINSMIPHYSAVKEVFFFFFFLKADLRELMSTSRHVTNGRKWDTRMDIFLWKFSQTWARLLKEGGQEMEKRPCARALRASPPAYRPPKQSFWRRKKRGPNMGMESVAAGNKSGGSCNPLRAARSESHTRSSAIRAAAPNSSRLLSYCGAAELFDVFWLVDI